MLNILDMSYNLEEFRDLCFDMQVDYDNLGGEGKRAKARELLLLIYRQDRLPELLEVVAKDRPEVPLPDLQTVQKQAKTWRKISTRAERIRQTLIQNVRSVWVESVLHHANDILLSLDLTHTPKALQRDMPILLQDNEGESPVDSSLLELFEENGRRLLILGEPGSGKSFTLLQLAEVLLEQAEHDLIHPIPVVLNLSSWAQARKPLPIWIAEEMLAQYQVALKVTSTWLEQDELLLLLDGLDEVDETHRNECLLTINSFMAEHQTELVVCSRITDYEQLKDRLNVSAAVQIQPLTDSEINRYLSQPGLELQTMLEADPGMHELARSPLMLTVMSLAYHGLSQEELTPLDSIEERRKHLFGKYVEQVFRRRPLENLNNNLKWLTHLAQGMSQERLSVFNIEQLQPTWLSSERGYLSLIGIPLGLSTIPFFFIFFIAMFTLLYAQLGLSSEIFTLSIVVLGGLGGGVGGYFGSFSTNKWKRFTITIISSSLIAGLLLGLFLGLLIASKIDIEPIHISGLTGIVVVGAICGIFIGLGVGLTTLNPKIDPVERLRLSIPKRQDVLIKLRQGIVIGVVLGVIIGLLITLYYIAQLNEHWLWQIILFVPLSWFFTWAFGLVGGLILGLLVSMVGIITAFLQVGKIERKTIPNQGMRNSAKNGLLMFIVASIIFLPLILVLSLINPDYFIVFTLVFALPISIYYGFSPVIKHCILRFLLAWNRILPIKLVPFLDAMAERIILRKVGGGYIFIHRYLLEYFANLDPTESIKD